MSIITPKNKSQSAITRTDSLKARPTENRLQDDGISPSGKLSELQVTNPTTTGAETDAGENKKSKDDHEHPCVCDLNLPRKPLTNEERYAKAKDYLRNETKSQDGTSSPNLNKTIHASPADSKSSNTKSSKSKSSSKDSIKRKGARIDKKSTPTRKKLEKTEVEGKSKTAGKKTSKEASGRVTGKGFKEASNESAGGRFEEVSGRFQESSGRSAGGRSKSAASGSSSSKSVEGTDSSLRKNIRWKRKPQIAVKLNRTAALRLEKGNNVYCGYKPPPVSKVDEYFAKRAKKLAAARARAKAEALAAAMKGKTGAGGSGAGGAGGAGGSTREEDFLAGAKCEYMRCRRYAKK